MPPLEIEIPAALKNFGRELVEALDFSDENFSAVLKSFREELFVAKIHPEILSAFIAKLFAEEKNFLPDPLQSEKFLNLLRSRQGKDYLPPTIRLALRYIETNYRKDLSQSSVAEAVHLNPSYFSTLFKKSVGKGFSDYLTEIRIAHVKEKLSTTSKKSKTLPRRRASATINIL